MLSNNSSPHPAVPALLSSPSVHDRGHIAVAITCELVELPLRGNAWLVEYPLRGYGSALGRRYGCTTAGLRVGRHGDRAAFAASYVTVLWTFHFCRTATLGGQTDRPTDRPTNTRDGSHAVQPRTVGTKSFRPLLPPVSTAISLLDRQTIV